MVKSNYTYISGKDLIKKLNDNFWLDIISQKWSHIKIQLHSNNRKTIIPNHKELAYGTFSWILEQLQITEDEFLSM
jgi:predicted RNA binding protein YcfA (HicA-like mRNA interferase family)